MFYPTHRHADGGLYQELGPQSGRSGEYWLPGVAYRNEEGKLFWTEESRWAERFEQINPSTSVVDIADDQDEAIASFRFAVHEVSDIRYMVVSAGVQNNSAVAREFVGWMKRVFAAQAEAIAEGLHIRDHDFPDLIGDVAAFHAKFGQEYTGKPRMLPHDLFDFRVKFHDEETGEYRDEQLKLIEAIERKDRRDIVNSLELQLDALCDAAWVLLGTADLQFGRKAFYEAWRRVVKANMSKVRKDAAEDGHKDSGRAPKYDIVKPAGWEAPDHRDLVIDNAIFDEIFALPAPDVETNGFNQDAGSYSDTRQV